MRCLWNVSRRQGLRLVAAWDSAMWPNQSSQRSVSWRLRGAAAWSYSCYLTPHHVHAAHAVTGVICVTCCASIQNTVASGVARLPAERVTESAAGGVAAIRIEHPSGAIDVRLETERGGAELRVRSAGITLTARKIMDGQVFVPESSWLRRERTCVRRDV